MSFLNPILLFGMGAVAVPILIHLLNRRRFRRVVWAAMRFLQASVERNRRRMRLEDLILLVLRCALIALLAAALARPALKSEAGDLLGQAKVTGVLILDTSSSMGVTDGVATRLEKAKSVAEDVVDGLPAGSALAVWSAGDGYEGLVPEPTYDLNLARKAVREVGLTDRSTDLFPSLRAAVGTLRDRLGVRREIYLVTDGQAVGWRHWSEIRELLRKVRGEITVHLLLVQDGELENVGVTELRLAGGLAPVDEAVRFEAQIQNFGQRDLEDLQLTLSVDGHVAEDGLALDQLAAGNSRTVSMFGKLPTAGYHSVTVRAGEDRLPADDQRTVAVRGLGQVRVLLIDGEPGPEARAGETFFLGHALKPVPAAHQPSYFIQTTRVTLAELAGLRWDDYDAVVLANVPDLTLEALAGLEAYLRRGGGLIVFVGERTHPRFYNDQLFEARRILPAALGPAAGHAEQETNFISLAAGPYEHPMVELWNDPAAGTLESARFFRHLTLLPEEEGALGSEREAGPARVVARYADGTPAIMERPWGLGRVVLFGSTADTAWNDLGVRPAFVPLVHRVLAALLTGQDSGLNIQVGERFVRRMPLEYLDHDALISKPGETASRGELRRVQLLGGRPSLQYEQTDRAGLYQVEVGDDPPFRLRFAAQANPIESDLEGLTGAQLEALEGLVEVVHGEVETELRDQLKSRRAGMELWWLVVWVVIGLALLESGLAQWFSRSK